ncbi:uncharacterized protein LOC119514841 [Choloepus didactylus]|uniref:uncharacterized protein LOC119514841 n=1 Tax=Choloepus didactylus TaxID=27675 RepID=UPI00189EC32A|nr:uncharacterized protein LOC119514841 [Choloepus didactylus]
MGVASRNTLADNGGFKQPEQVTPVPSGTGRTWAVPAALPGRTGSRVLSPEPGPGVGSGGHPLPDDLSPSGGAASNLAGGVGQGSGAGRWGPLSAEPRTPSSVGNPAECRHPRGLGWDPRSVGSTGRRGGSGRWRGHPLSTRDPVTDGEAESGGLACGPLAPGPRGWMVTRLSRGGELISNTLRLFCAHPAEHLVSLLSCLLNELKCLGSDVRGVFGEEQRKPALRNLKLEKDLDPGPGRSRSLPAPAGQRPQLPAECAARRWLPGPRDPQSQPGWWALERPELPSPRLTVAARAEIWGSALVPPDFQILSATAGATDAGTGPLAPSSEPELRAVVPSSVPSLLSPMSPRWENRRGLDSALGNGQPRPCKAALPPSASCPARRHLSGPTRHLPESTLSGPLTTARSPPAFCGLRGSDRLGPVQWPCPSRTPLPVRGPDTEPRVLAASRAGGWWPWYWVAVPSFTSLGSKGGAPATSVASPLQAPWVTAPWLCAPRLQGTALQGQGWRSSHRSPHPSWGEVRGDNVAGAISSASTPHAHQVSHNLGARDAPCAEPSARTGEQAAWAGHRPHFGGAQRWPGRG